MQYMDLTHLFSLDLQTLPIKIEIRIIIFSLSTAKNSSFLIYKINVIRCPLY